MKKTVIRADLLEMVFARREKSYGAYELRKNYSSRLTKATVLVLLLFVSGAVAPLVARYLKPDTNITTETVKPIEVDISELPIPPKEDDPIPPEIQEVKPQPPRIETIEYRTPEPTPEDEMTPEDEDKTIAKQDDLEKSTPGLVTQEGDKAGALDGIDDGDGNIPSVIVEKPKEKEKPKEPGINDLIFVQKEPAPVNMSDIRKSIGYPQIARDASIEGMVVIRILVDKSGNYKKHKIIKQAHPMLAKACEKHVGKLKFTPAIQGGKPIQFWVNVPFRFKLER